MALDLGVRRLATSPAPQQNREPVRKLEAPNPRTLLARTAVEVLVHKQATGRGPASHAMNSPSTAACPFCEAAIGSQAKKCRHCGEWVSRSCERCGTPIRAEWAARGLCAECQRLQHPPAASATPLAIPRKKSRGVAAFTAFFPGGIGLHRFYLGNYLAGFVYLFFSWTLIPALAGLIEGIRYALMEDGEFHQRYSPM